MTGGHEQLTARLDEVTLAMESLTAMLDSELDLGQMLQAVCDHVVQVVPGADMASITLVREGVPETVASTDQRAVNFDREQYRIGDGPCLRAAETGQPVRVGVGAVGDLWPQFVTSAAQLGVASFLAAPLTVDEDMSGAVNLFGCGDRPAQRATVLRGPRTGRPAQPRAGDPRGDRPGQGHPDGGAPDHGGGSLPAPGETFAGRQPEAPRGGGGVRGGGGDDDAVTRPPVS
jgi:hypothetical protein